MEILQIKDLTFRYPERAEDALEDVCLSVDAGEFVLLCGRSGCGKSTLLKLLKRELAPFGELFGEIGYNGKPIKQLDDRTAASEIGFVLQNPDSQIVTDTVWHELAFGLENLGYPTPVIRRRVAEMASYFGIEDWFDQKTADLSGGQKQLLNLAAVMAMQPKLLLLDEPTAQLDPIAAGNFIATLQKLNRELGLTILLVEHRLEEVFPIADRVLLMEEGKLVFDGRPQTISEYFHANPDHPMLAGLPTAMRVFHALEGVGESPITVREGRDYITKHFDNGVKAVKKPPYTHSDEKAVELSEVFFRYERDLPDVLDGLSLSVYKGEHFCILGGNGSGKTTTLGIIAGLRKAYRGKVRVLGKKISEYKGGSLYQGGVALLPQNPQTVFLEKTVGADLDAVCETMQYTGEEAEQRIFELAEKLQIVHLLDRHPYDLSGGEQQKAALCKILLQQPKILLLDEPTKGIDAGAKQTLASILNRLKKGGMTIITVTHDVAFAAENADRCGLFFGGDLVSTDTPNAFFGENHFYTTATHRMTRGYYDNTVTLADVVALCRLNGRKEAADG